MAGNAVFARIVAVMTVLMGMIGSSLEASGQAVHVVFVGVIGDEGSSPGQFLEPSGVAVDPAGQVYVVDTGNHRVQQFDANGRSLRYIGGFGFDAQQFNQPADLAATGLDVYVADTQNRRIQRLDRHLNFLATLAAGLAGPDQTVQPFGFPRSVAVSSIGDLYITDAENEEVVKLSLAGRLETRFGGFSHGPGRLRTPAGLTISRSGEVYVADTGNNRIAVFDTFGGFLRELGAKDLAAPEGVDVDHEGRVYVADTGHDRVVIFSTRGERLLVFGTRGTGLGSFRAPRDVAFSRPGTLYVVDTGNHRVQKFEVKVSQESLELDQSN